MTLDHSRKNISFGTLHVVREVLRTKSLTQAANRLGISQPAVSGHLKRFETAFGFAAIVRSGNAMEVSSAKVIEVVDQLLALEDSLKRAGQDSTQANKKFGICQSWSAAILENVEEASYLFNHYNVLADCSSKLQSLFERGKLDVLIRPVSKFEDPLLSASLPLVWCGNFHFDQALNSEPLRVILGTEVSDVGKIARQWLEEKSFSYTVVLETDNPSISIPMCHKLNAVTLTPSFVAGKSDVSVKRACSMADSTLEMLVGLFFSERTVSLVDAEICFGLFEELVNNSCQLLRAAS